MYMDNATYIPLTRVGGFALGDANSKICVALTHISGVFRYQHVGIGNAKLWRWPWVSKAMPIPNANGFASQ